MKAIKKNNNIRNDVIYDLQRVVKANFCTSFYVPIREGITVLDTAFLYRAAPSSDVTLRPRPFAKVVIEPEKQLLVAYQDARIYDFMDTEAYPMSEKIDYSVPARTAAEQFKLIKNVNELYKKIRLFPWKDSELSEDEAHIVSEYAACFYQTIPKSLLPFYEALSPEFFAWLSEKRGQQED